MSVVVFAGPSIYGLDPAKLLEATFLGPAAAGDVTRAALDADCRAIGLIDGYFERTPSVWHKEILFALSRGIHVFGAASMGALRAADLHTFGMEGVGEIFEAFRDGLLEDDDEVAVVHGPAETRFRPASEAMVNVRTTVAAAERAGVFGPEDGSLLVRVAKELFYPERSYPTILDGAERAGARPALRRDFMAFLADGRVDQKQADARRLLETLSERLAAGLGRKHVRYPFHASEHFVRLELGVRADGGGVV